jgi:hypothetical protein
MTLTEIDLSKQAKDGTLTPSKISTNIADDFTFPHDVTANGDIYGKNFIAQGPGSSLSAVTVSATTVNATTISTGLITDLSLITAIDIGNRLLKASDGSTIVNFATPGTLDVFATLMNMNGNSITNLNAPTNPNDAATKTYVDSVAQGLTIKVSCTAATVVPLITVTPSGSGTGKTLTATVNGVLALDGVNTWFDVVHDGYSPNPVSITPPPASRVLVKDQTNASDNGIYCVTNKGTVSSPYILTRAEDFDGIPTIESGSFTFIALGTVNAGSGWILSTPNPIIIDTTPLSFTQFSGAGQIIAGNGLTKSGNQLDVAPSDTSLTVSIGNISVKRDPAGAIGLTGAGIAINAGNGLSITGNAIGIAGPVSVANGGTGVTTSTGSGSVVLSNSPTLVTPALGTPSSLVLTNATNLSLVTGVTGILPVANGGTNSSASLSNGFLMASSGGQIVESAITSSSTGTGSVVLSNSPTLVTPVLGTPTSVTLTNATGLPLTTGVTGLLPVANGGTGTATPGLIAGTNITSITGSWPNQTINAANQITTPAGLNTQIQYNNAGAFGASGNLAFTGTALNIGFGSQTGSNVVLSTVDTSASGSPNVGGNLTLTTGISDSGGVQNTGGSILLTTGASTNGNVPVVGGGITLTSGSTGGGDVGGSILLTSFTASKGGNLTLTGTGASHGTITAGGNMSIDGATFNIDAVNHRVAVGTSTPGNGGSFQVHNGQGDIYIGSGFQSQIQLIPNAGSHNPMIVYNQFGAGSAWTAGSASSSQTLPGSFFIRQSGNGAALVIDGTTNGNVAIGPAFADASAVLDVQSPNAFGTIGGLLFPRLTTTQKNAIASPAAGLVVYDTTLSLLQVYNGSAWVNAAPGQTYTAGTGLTLSSNQFSLTTPVSVANGGTGTATPGLIAGTNITSITGSWPNQTINAATQTTPPGGSSGNIQYNNGGVFAGASNVTTDGTNVTVNGSGSISLTSPLSSSSQSGGGISISTGINTGAGPTVGGGLSLSTGAAQSGTLANGNMTGGSITLSTGLFVNGTGTPTVQGGSLNLTTGQAQGSGGTTTVIGGGINLSTGPLLNAGTLTGGSITLSTGNYPNASGSNVATGGSITLTSGNSNGGTDVGGTIKLTSFTPANGGSLVLTGTGANGTPSVPAHGNIYANFGNFSNLVLTTPLPLSSGGTGTATPGLIAGTNITSITGSWPNQTINAANQVAGANTQLQFNNGGVFGASPNLTLTSGFILNVMNGANGGSVFVGATHITEGAITVNGGTGTNYPFIQLQDHSNNNLWNIEIPFGSADDFQIDYNSGTPAIRFSSANNNTSMGTSSNAVPSAQLELVSTTKGFLPPRMSTAQKNAISSPATGLVVYDTGLSLLQVWNGSSWVNAAPGQTYTAGTGLTLSSNQFSLTTPVSVANGGTGTATPGLIAGTNITSITGSWPNQTINAATQTTPAAGANTQLQFNNGGAFGASSGLTWNGTTLTATNLSLTNPLPISSGGTGTTTPGLVAGTNVTITGSWPNQTINASGGTGTVTQNTYVVGTASGTYSGSTTLFSLPFTYVQDGKSLQVFYNGQLLVSGVDYNETSSSSVTTINPLVTGAEIVFRTYLSATQATNSVAQYANFVVGNASGTYTGSTTVYNLPFAYTQDGKSLQVFYDGVQLVPGDDYTETSSTSITTTQPLALNQKIAFRTISAAGAAAAVTTLRENYVVGTASGNYTGSTTVFNLVNSYTPGGVNLIVFLDGDLQTVGATVDYIETNGTTVTFNNALIPGERVTFLFSQTVAAAGTVSSGTANTLVVYPSSGSTVSSMTANASAGGNKITNLANGVSAADAVNLSQLKVLQIGIPVFNSTSTSVTTATWTDTTLSATITPSTVGSRILVVVSQQGYVAVNSGATILDLRIVQGASTVVQTFASALSGPTTAGQTGAITSQLFISAIDSPATTSPVTYKTQLQNQNALSTAATNRATSGTAPTSMMLLIEVV